MNIGWIAFAVLLGIVLFLAIKYGAPWLVDLYRSATGK